MTPLIGAASAIWWLADYYGGEKYSARFYYYWNTAIHFLGFLINAVTIAKIKLDLDQRHVLAAELEATRSTLRALAARLPACPSCGRPHDRPLPAHASSAATLDVNLSPIADALCDDCCQRLTQPGSPQRTASPPNRLIREKP